MWSWLGPGSFLRRLFHPRRTIWPTRDGWWSLLVVIGLGVAAINTGNNLLYLLDSLLFGLIVVSGVLSEMVDARSRLSRASSRRRSTPDSPRRSEPRSPTASAG